MNKRFVPVISDTVLVPVKGSFKDSKGQSVPFKYSLICKRISASDMKGRISSGDFDMKEIMREVTSGWEGQRLITDEETKQPAEFCAEAFDALLDISGMALLCFTAYTKEASANEKN